MLIDGICKKKPNDLCIDLEIILETDLTVVGFIYQGICRSLKDTLKSNTVRGHSWTLYIHSCKMNQIPAVLMVMQIGSCGVKFSVTAPDVDLKSTVSQTTNRSES